MSTKRALLEAQMPVRRKQGLRAAKICAGYFTASAVGAAVAFAVAVEYDEHVEMKVAPKMQGAVESQAKGFMRQHIPFSEMYDRVANVKEGEDLSFKIEISSEDISAYKNDVRDKLVDRAENQLNVLFVSALSVFGGAAYMTQKYGRRSRQKFVRAQSMKRHLNNLDNE